MPKSEDPAQHHMFNSEYIEHLREKIEDRDEIIRKLESKLEDANRQNVVLRGELGV